MKTEEHLKCDVVCVGGGSAGVFAAVSAAQEGARVILLERAGFLGGAAALGEPLRGLPPHLTQIQKRFLEILQDLKGVERVPDENVYAVNGESLKLALYHLCRENAVDTFLFSEPCEVKVHDGIVTGLRVVSKNAAFEIEAPVLIDATGTGDVARSAGISVRSLDRGVLGSMILTGVHPDKWLANGTDYVCEEGFLQEVPGTRYWGSIYQGGPVCSVSNCMETHRYLLQFPVEGVAGSLDGAAGSEAIMSAHVQALCLFDRLRNQPGFEEIKVSQMPVQSGIYGFYEIKGLEQEEQYQAENTVAKVYKEDGRISYIGLEHLIPAGIEGLIVCGNLALQGMEDRFKYSRAISLITGEAAGHCAGLAVRNRCSIRDIIR